MKYDQHSSTNEFRNSLSLCLCPSVCLSLSFFLFSHILLPHIVQTTIIRNNSETLIGNIYSNVITPNSISSNLTAAISEHLPQYLIAPENFRNLSSTKLNTFERDWSKFNQEIFILDYLSVDWKNSIQIIKMWINPVSFF